MIDITQLKHDPIIWKLKRSVLIIWQQEWVESCHKVFSFYLSISASYTQESVSSFLYSKESKLKW